MHHFTQTARGFRKLELEPSPRPWSARVAAVVVMLQPHATLQVTPTARGSPPPHQLAPAFSAFSATHLVTTRITVLALVHLRSDGGMPNLLHVTDALSIYRVQVGTLPRSVHGAMRRSTLLVQKRYAQCSVAGEMLWKEHTCGLRVSAEPTLLHDYADDVTTAMGMRRSVIVVI